MPLDPLAHVTYKGVLGCVEVTGIETVAGEMDSSLALRTVNYWVKARKVREEATLAGPADFTRVKVHLRLQLCLRLEGNIERVFQLLQGLMLV